MTAYLLAHTSYLSFRWTAACVQEYVGNFMLPQKMYMAMSSFTAEAWHQHSLPSSFAALQGASELCVVNLLARSL